MNKTIKEFSEVELKAIKSDLYETMSKCQNDLAIINQELESRQKKEKEEVVEKVEEVKE